MPASVQEKMRAMNEALVLGLVRQHELTDVAHSLNVQLQNEIVERQEAETALRASEQRYRTLFELGPVGVYSSDASGLIVNFNRRATELWGRAPVLDDPGDRFCGSFRLFDPAGARIPLDQCPMADVLSGKVPAVADQEVHVERPDGSRVTIVVNIRPLTDDSGKIVGAVNCFYDITDRKNAEERQRFLMNELAHRGKNLLAVVQALASRSLSGKRPLAEERELLSQRIQALARSQSSQLAGGLEGAAVAEIVRLECESFADRVTVRGPDVMLIRRVGQTFTLALHELATNAVKYGALVNPGGRIAIAWSVEGAGAAARFRFQWREQGGPPVVPPTRKGFGRLLLESAAAQDFGGLPVVKFEPSGLIYEIDAPLQAIVLAADSGRPEPP
ncbi:MAG: HWE histidine kinase domain-containing protein [Reyranella sp.]|nr:HWE histidine kinase domain-containing protein [Reyranella sp.]